MSVHVECEYCGAEYHVGEDKIGRTLKCRECGERTEVRAPRPKRSSRGESTGGRSAGRSSSRGSSRKRGAAKSDSGTAMLIVKIVSALAGGVVGFVVVSGLFRGGNGPDAQVAQNDGVTPVAVPKAGTQTPIGADGSPVLPGAGAPSGGINPFAVPGGAGTGAGTGTPPSQNDLMKQALDQAREQLGETAAANFAAASSVVAADSSEPALSAAAQREITSGWSTVVTIENPAEPGRRLKALDAPPRPATWNVEPDALAAPVEYSDRPISVPVQSGSSIWFAPAPSNLMAIGKLPSDFQIVSLKELKPIHSPKTSVFGANGFALSPDGSRFATLARKPEGGILQVYESSSGQLIKELPPVHRLLAYYEFLDNDRVLASYPEAPGASFSGQAMAIHVFSVESGQSLCPVDFGGAEHKGIRLSANRRLGACFNAEKRLVFCDLTTGKRVGEVELVEPPLTAAHPDAAGFSSDGREFAMLTWNTLLNWDLTTGRLTHRHNGSRELYPPPSGEDRPLVEFLDDGSGWLVGGRVWVDRDSGLPRWTVAEKRFGSRQPSRLLPNLQLLDVQDADAFSGRLAMTGLSSAARTIDTSEVEEFDRTIATHPPIRRVASRGPAIPLPVDDVAWGGGSVAAAKAESLQEMIGVGSQDVKEFAKKGTVAMTQQEIGTFSVPAAFKSYPGFRQVRSVSLVSGELIGTAPAREESTPAAVSPSGKTGVAVSGRNEKSIDVFDFVASKNVVSLNPFDDGTWLRVGDSLKLTLLDDARLLMTEALREKSAVSLWELPSGWTRYQVALTPRELPRADGNSKYSVQPTALSTSSDGKYLAIADGPRVRMLDTETGKVIGDLLLPALRDSGFNPPSVSAGDFSPTGQQFAAWIPGNGQNFVCVWSLADGQVAEVFPLAHPSLQFVTGLQWITDDRLVLNQIGYASLIDLPRRCVIWKFSGTAKFTVGGKFHFIDTDRSGGETRSVLVTSELPAAEIEAALKQQLPQARVVLTNGGSVKLQHGQYSGGVDGNFTQTVTSSVTGNLQEIGVSIDPAASLTLKLTMTQGKTENVQREYRQTFGGGGTQSFSFSITGYDLSAELVDPAGEVVWMVSQHASNDPPFFSITKQNTNLQAELVRQGNEALKRTVETFFTKLQLPETVYFQPVAENGTVAGLGSTQIGWGSGNSPVTGAVASATARAAAGRLPGAATPEPTITEAELLTKCRAIVNATYGDILSSDESSWGTKLSWSPALKRTVVGVRWGLGVQFQKPPGNVKVEIQPKRKDMLAQLAKASVGAGPALVDSIEAMIRAGQLGSWSSSADTVAKETILLGAGSQHELIAAARKARLDFLVITYFGQGRGRQARETTMEFRVLDAASGEKLFTSDIVSESELGKAGVDLGVELAGKVADFVKAQIAPQSGTPLERASVGERMRLLTEQESANPMAELTEIRFYLSQELTNEASAMRAAQKILSQPVEARTIVTGDPAARSDLVKQLVDRWK
ncbi:hypothetical protein GC176_12625 [bacterium]|nr:hypothetical protein [bacterium]